MFGRMPYDKISKASGHYIDIDMTELPFTYYYPLTSQVLYKLQCVTGLLPQRLTDKQEPCVSCNVAVCGLKPVRSR